jgi:hypothetical protein
MLRQHRLDSNQQGRLIHTSRKFALLSYKRQWCMLSPRGGTATLSLGRFALYTLSTDARE